MPTGRDIAFDLPLSNLAVRAFQPEPTALEQLFPVVNVDRQFGNYYVIDRDSWLLVPNTRRAPKNSARRIDWRISSEQYFCHNYALAGEMAKEDLANEDRAVRLRENTTLNVVQALRRDLRLRIANLVTSGSNVGSYVSLGAAAKWNNYTASDPIADVTTAHAFIRQRTGFEANTLVLDADTYEVVRRHPVLLDMFKYTNGGVLDDAALKNAFRVQNILRVVGNVNRAPEGATASLTNIFGDNALLAYVSPDAPDLMTATFGLAFRWRGPEDEPAYFQVRTYDDPDPSRKVSIVEVGYYQDERIVARDLAYLIADTL